MFLRKKIKEPQNIDEILTSFKDLEVKFKEIEEKVSDFDKRSKLSFQKIGIVRFNPFSDVGGNQSFSLCLLNNNNNGFIITSFYTREGSSVYGKPIKDGKSEYSLSKEEQDALSKALE